MEDSGRVHHVAPIRVVFGDCDPAGIVFFPNFYRWFDQATQDMLTAAGYSLHAARERHGWVGFPIAEAAARFIRTATFDDLLEVHTTVIEWRRKVFLLRHRVMRGDELVAEGSQTRFIGVRLPENDGRISALLLPESFRTDVEALAGG